jgi:hypothetical protein
MRYKKKEEEKKNQNSSLKIDVGGDIALSLSL